MYKYTTGDYVRPSLTKQLFKKGYLNNFTEEVFVIHEHLLQNSLMYTVKGLLDRPTEITSYMEELQKVTKPEIFRVEQILEKKECRHQMYYKVQWKGYSKDFDAWLMENVSDS